MDHSPSLDEWVASLELESLGVVIDEILRGKGGRHFGVSADTHPVIQFVSRFTELSPEQRLRVRNVVRDRAANWLPGTEARVFVMLLNLVEMLRIDEALPSVVRQLAAFRTWDDQQEDAGSRVLVAAVGVLQGFEDNAVAHEAMEDLFVTETVAPRVGSMLLLGLVAADWRTAPKRIERWLSLYRRYPQHFSRPDIVLDRLVRTITIERFRSIFEEIQPGDQRELAILLAQRPGNVLETDHDSEEGALYFTGRRDLGRNWDRFRLPFQRSAHEWDVLTAVEQSTGPTRQVRQTLSRLRNMK